MKEINVSRADYRKVDKAVKKAEELVRRGYQEKQVVRSVKKYLKGIKIPFSARDAYIAARLRIRGREKFGELSSKLFFDESGYRYSTPSAVAEYRAERLENYSVADVSCGVGMQLCYFGFNREAVGVEIEEKRAYLAALNVTATGSNSTVFHGDAFEFRLKDVEVIFSDPARPESEEIRTLNSLQPNPVKIMEKLDFELFAFELPPQMPPARVDRSFEGVRGEKEYTSLNFRLNRLAFYTGELADCDVSSVSLPSRERVTSEDEKARLNPLDVDKENMKTVAEVDRTIIHSGLLENLAGKLGLDARIVLQDSRRTLLSVENKVPSAFLRYYDLLFTANSMEECKRRLKEVNAGKVTLRFGVNPGEYWKVRKKFEEGLKGEEHVYLFKVKDHYLACVMSEL